MGYVNEVDVVGGKVSVVDGSVELFESMLVEG